MTVKLNDGLAAHWWTIANFSDSRSRMKVTRSELQHHIYSAPSGVLRSVCLSVCLCVCLSVREHISGTAGPIFTKFLVQIPCGRVPVLLLWRSCATLGTSGFVDDVTFGRNGPYGDA